MEGIVHHSTHPGHPLNKVYGNEEFHCNGCAIPGFGRRYRCHHCDFNMHEYCAVCPSDLSTFMHPEHRLYLISRWDRSNRVCDLCGDGIEGMSYRCADCNFDVHPLCTSLLQYVSHHTLHPSCPLKLRKTTSPARCGLCRRECYINSWVYGCSRGCHFDIHLACILMHADQPMTSRSLQAPFPPPWPYVFMPQQQQPPPNTWGVNGGLVPSNYGPFYGPPPVYGHHPSMPPPVYQWPPGFPSNNYGYPQVMHHPHPNHQVQPSSGIGTKLSRIISALAGHLSMEVTTNLLANGITDWVFPT